VANFELTFLLSAAGSQTLVVALYYAEITPSHDAPASIASLREVGSRMNAVTRAAPRKKNPISKSRTRALLRGE